MCYTYFIFIIFYFSVFAFIYLFYNITANVHVEYCLIFFFLFVILKLKCNVCKLMLMYICLCVCVVYWTVPYEIIWWWFSVLKEKYYPPWCVWLVGWLAGSSRSSAISIKPLIIHKATDSTRKLQTETANGRAHIRTQKLSCIATATWCIRQQNASKKQKNQEKYMKYSWNNTTNWA